MEKRSCADRFESFSIQRLAFVTSAAHRSHVDLAVELENLSYFIR